jgi:hypothetical protein
MEFASPPPVHASLQYRTITVHRITAQKTRPKKHVYSYSFPNGPPGTARARARRGTARRGTALCGTAARRAVPDSAAAAQARHYGGSSVPCRAAAGPTRRGRRRRFPRRGHHVSASSPRPSRHGTSGRQEESPSIWEGEESMLCRVVAVNVVQSLLKRLRRRC